VEIEVVRSARRRRQVEGRFVNGVLRVSVPGWMSRAEEATAVADMVGRFERRRATDEIDLKDRAAALARRYRLPEPASIGWSDRQRGRWGSCTPIDRTIRISRQLGGVPSWVLDYVIVHELAHLVEPDHGPAFRELESRYPKVERATGYLMAMSEGLARRRSGPRVRPELAGQAALFA
jgi:hypothetical protein